MEADKVARIDRRAPLLASIADVRMRANLEECWTTFFCGEVVRADQDKPATGKFRGYLPSKLNGLLMGLLLADAALALADAKGWLGFGERKGWAVLLATALSSLVLLFSLSTISIGALLGYRCRFGLGTILLIVAVIAVPCGWLTSSVRHAKQQKEIIALLSKRECSIVCNPDRSWDRRQVRQPTAPAPAWLTDFVGEDFFVDVVFVAALRYGIHPHVGDGVSLTDSDLELIGSFKQLHEFCWFFKSHIDVLTRQRVEPRFTNAGLQHLHRLTNLQRLTLANSDHFDDAGLEQIAKITGLQSLELHSMSRISDAGLRHLKGPARLRELSLYEMPGITNDGMAPIAEIRSLKGLFLDGMPISDQGIRSLSAMTQLEELSLKDTHITDAALATIGKLTSLRVLELGGTELSDEGMVHIANLTQLQYLGLSNTAVTDKGISQIGKLSAIEFLDLGRTDVSDTGIAHLYELQNLRDVSLADTDVTDKGKQALARVQGFQIEDFDDLSWYAWRDIHYSE